MASPFPTNAVLTFSVGTGALTTDPLTGNKQPALITTTVKAYLTPQGRAGVGNPSAKYWAGLDEGIESLSGRCTDPLFLPAGVGHQSKAWAVITDLVTGKTQAGWFTLSRGTASPFKTESVLGASIGGSFRSQTVAGGAVSPTPQPTPGQYPASIALSLHKLVALVHGQLVYANASDATQTGAIGLTLNAVAAGGKPQFATSGLVQDGGWNWTVDQPVFVGLAGALTQAPSIAAPGYYQEVGVAVSAMQLSLNLGEAYLL